MHRKHILFFLTLMIISCATFGQRQIQVNGFGHLDYTLNYFPDQQNKIENYGRFGIGEHDLFVSGAISRKVSFLGEFVVKPSRMSATGFSASIERARIKYNYYKNHSILVGKMHTAVNYWNDVYHHGRMFFPTIDRPLNFSYFVPIHSLGIRLRGQNLGKLKFGYDFQIANGMSPMSVSNDIERFSYNASVHVKPINGMRIMMGYNNDILPTNSTGSHAHSTLAHHDSYKGKVALNQFYFSISKFESKFELLNEFAIINSTSDSLGTSLNYTNYLYTGYRIKDKYIPFAMVDFLLTSDKELYVSPINALKYSIGLRCEFTPMIAVKMQLENMAGFN